MQKMNFSRMINKNNYHETYNDGYIHYGIIEIIRNSNKVKTGEKIKEIGIVPFANSTIRDNDNLVAESLGYTINKKIRVPFIDLPQNIKVMINNDNIVYDIVKRDTSDNINLYLYLQIASNTKDVVA